MKGLRRFLCVLLLLVATFGGTHGFDRHDYHQFVTTRNCPNCDLRGADFSGMDFRDADLRGANLSKTIFRGANLSNADLFGATLEGTDFSEARWVDQTLCDLDSIDRCVPKRMDENQN